MSWYDLEITIGISYQVGALRKNGPTERAAHFYLLVGCFQYRWD